MLTAFYIIVAVCVVFVVLSLQVVKAHEKKMAKKAEEKRDEASDMPVAQEDEFFDSPIYKAMEVIAHL